MGTNIIIPDQRKFEATKMAISAGGVEKLHILSDFDKTLTKSYVDGKRINSIISILRNNDCLTPDYPKKAKDLYAKYHSIETDFTMPIEKKKKIMRDWWLAHFNLLIKSGLTKDDLMFVVNNENIEFRDGVPEFLRFLKKYNIPLIVLSASGLGKEAISMFFKQKEVLYDNIYIISNSFKWDENGRAIGVNEPIIHSMNKDETMVKDFPVFNLIKERKNILLLGDSISDVGMVAGFNYNSLIKIGFLNKETERNLEEYKRNYDVLILNDGSMDYVNNLLNEIVKDD